MEHCYFLGIDGGGSKCKARLEDHAGQKLSEFTSGPANPMRDYATTLKSIESAIKGAIDEANLPVGVMVNTHAVIGLAGLNIPDCMNKMKEWKHPFASLELTTDLRIACVGAHEVSNGAIVIIGTGSSGIVCDGDNQFEHGGHGFMLGDKGSGAWFGMQCIRHVLEVIDGIQPSSEFVKSVMQVIKLNTSHSIVGHYANAEPVQFAKIAPIVFDYAEMKDPTAMQIVQDGADYITLLCEQMLQRSPKRFAFIGGLAHKLIPWLSPEIQALLKEPMHPPEVGAILIARDQHVLNEVL